MGGRSVLRVISLQRPDALQGTNVCKPLFSSTYEGKPFLFLLWLFIQQHFTITHTKMISSNPKFVEFEFTVTDSKEKTPEKIVHDCTLDFYKIHTLVPLLCYNFQFFDCTIFLSP